MYTRGAADHAVWAWLNKGRGFCEGVVCCGRGFVGVAFADNQQSLSLFCSLKKVFFEGKDTQKHRTRWVGETW